MSYTPPTMLRHRMNCILMHTFTAFKFSDGTRRRYMPVNFWSLPLITVVFFEPFVGRGVVMTLRRL